MITDHPQTAELAHWLQVTLGLQALVPDPAAHADEIHHAAQESDAALIVGAAGASPRLAPARLLKHAPCPVVFAPRAFTAADSELRVIDVGLDSGSEARAALTAAAAIGEMTGATLRVIAVGRPARADLPADVSLQPILRDEVDRLPSALRADPQFVLGDVCKELTERSASADLLVLGSHGRGLVGRLALGGVAATVVDRATCPVLCFPLGTAEPFISRLLSRQDV